MLANGGSFSLRVNVGAIEADFQGEIGKHLASTSKTT